MAQYIVQYTSWTHLKILQTNQHMLTPKMRTKAYLMRVEVGIEDDDCICRPQIDAYTSCTGTENVNKDVRVGFVERVHVLLTHCLFRTSILVTCKTLVDMFEDKETL